MARQPMRWLTLGLVLLSCRQDEPYGGAFDVPVDAAILAEADGPFTEPVALVANAHGGKIAMLALKSGQFVVDDHSAGFLRGNWLPTGGARVLSSVAVWAPERFEVYAFAGDRHFEQLVQVPWVVGQQTRKLDGATRAFPVEEGPSSTAPCLVPAGTTWDPTDGSACPGEPTNALKNLELKHGYTTTEVWTLTWNAERRRWVVNGSRSGRQAAEVENGVVYKAAERRIGFTMNLPASALNDGDQIVFTTDNGLIEHDVGGAPEALAMAPDGSTLAMIVHDAGLDAPVLRWFDPATAEVTDVTLDAGARPTRMTWTDDGTALWVADSGLPVSWELTPGATSATRHDLPWPILDVAPLFGDRRRVFVVPEDGREVWVFDADTDEPIDINPNIEGDQGLFFGTPVSGIEAIPLEYRYQQTTEVLRQPRLRGRSVAVALQSGRIVFMEENTGCLVQDFLGPRTEPASSGGFSTSIDVALEPEVIGGPVMVRNAHNDRHVQVSPCSGVARDEGWTVRYDGSLGAWRVQSTVWGEHEAVAYEDQRYLSDNGEVSFTIRAGSTPTQDSWQFVFSVDEGSLDATGDADNDGLREVALGTPGDPVFYHYLAGREEQTTIDWRGGVITTENGKTDRAYILVPASGADNVGRINPENGSIEVDWL